MAQQTEDEKDGKHTDRKAEDAGDAYDLGSDCFRDGAVSVRAVPENQQQTSYDD